MSGKECVPAVVPRVTRILIFVRGVVTELKNARAMRRNLVIEEPRKVAVSAKLLG